MVVEGHLRFEEDVVGLPVGEEDVVDFEVEEVHQGEVDSGVVMVDMEEEEGLEGEEDLTDSGMSFQHRPMFLVFLDVTTVSIAILLVHKENKSQLPA